MPDKFGIDAATIPTVLSTLIKEYENKKSITLRDILDFYARFRNPKEALDLMGYCCPATGRGARQIDLDPEWDSH